MGLTAEMVRHDCENLSAIERIFSEGPELTISFHDEMGIDVAVRSLDVEIQVYWEIVF